MNEQLTRQQAKKLGYNRYQAKKPCKKCQSHERYVNNSACIGCLQVKNNRSYKSEPMPYQKTVNYHVQITYPARYWHVNLDEQLEELSETAIESHRGLGFGQAEEHYTFNNYNEANKFVTDARSIAVSNHITAHYQCSSTKSETNKLLLTALEESLYPVLKKKQRIPIGTLTERTLLQYLQQKGIVTCTADEATPTEEGIETIRGMNKKIFARFLQPLYETGKLSLFGNGR